jgi:hypothetical protein
MRHCLLTIPLKKLLLPDFWRSVQYRKLLGNIQFQKSNAFVPTEEANNTEKKRNNQEGNKVKEQKKTESVNSPNTSGLQGQKIQKKNSLEKDFPNQETSEDSDTKCCECWRNYLQTSKEDDWIKCVSCRNWLHDFILHKKMLRLR